MTTGAASQSSRLLPLAAIAASALSIIIALSAAWPVLEALIAPSPDREQSARDASAAHERALASWTGQIDGRSLFFTPAAPPPPPPPPTERDDSPPPPPPPPARYGGPQPVAMINDTVWFENDLRLSVGEAEDDLRLVDVVPPWEIVVEWEGVEFSVSLFERDTVVGLKAPETVAEAAVERTRPPEDTAASSTPEEGEQDPPEDSQ